MANNSTIANSTEFILPQWLLPKEPGMTCRPHGTIIGMLAAYNIISTIVSVIIAGPFFFRQQQQLKSLAGWLFKRLWKCISCRRNQGDAESNPEPEPVYLEFSFGGFIMSVLGSVAISLSAPLLTGTLISKGNPNADRWVLIEQWSTRPRATVFIALFNLRAACSSHREVMDVESTALESAKTDAFFETAVTALTTEFFVSFFGIKFLWDQTSIPSLDQFPSSSPCTSLGSAAPYGSPSNCPDMQIGAYDLIIGIIFNGIFMIAILLVTGCSLRQAKSRICFMFLFPLPTFVIYVSSWFIWVSFLQSASDDMYCIEASTPIDIIYCLLPVVLGLWRIVWSTTAKYHAD
jgi:hypothetical protein